MTIEEKYNEYIERTKAELEKHVDELITNIHCDLMPHVESDTVANVQDRSQKVIENMIAGDFEEDGPFAVKVKDDNGVTVTILMSEYEYDKIRKALVKAMPACPKDLEIESLKKKIQRMNEDMIYRQESPNEFTTTPPTNPGSLSGSLTLTPTEPLQPLPA